MSAGRELARRRVTNLAVPTPYFRAGQLPPVCVFSGESADGTVAVSAKSRIGAQWFLLLLGIFPLVLVRVLTIKRATGYLPIQRAGLKEYFDAQEPVKLLGRKLLLSAVVLGLMTSIPLWVDLDRDNTVENVYEILNLVLVAVAVGLFIASMITYGIHHDRVNVIVYLDRSGEFVTITPVSPGFARAASSLPPPMALTVDHPGHEPYPTTYGMQPPGGLGTSGVPPPYPQQYPGAPPDPDPHQYPDPQRDPNPHQYPYPQQYPGPHQYPSSPSPSPSPSPMPNQPGAPATQTADIFTVEPPGHPTVEPPSADEKR